MFNNTQKKFKQLIKPWRILCYYAVEYYFLIQSDNNCVLCSYHIHGTVIRSTDVHIALRSFLTPRLICRLRMATTKPRADYVCIACVFIIGHTQHTIRTVHTMHVIHVQYRTHICLIYTCIHRRQSMWGSPHDIMVYVDRSLCWLLAFLSPFTKVRCMAFMYAFYTCFYVFMNRRFVMFLRMICMYVRK
jgi:hypothetical protein